MPKKVLKVVASLLLFFVVLEARWVFNPFTGQLDFTESGGVTAPVSIANGGTGTGSTLVGLVRGSATAMTAAELSGDATTSGSNAVTVVKLRGNTIPATPYGSIFTGGSYYAASESCLQAVTVAYTDINNVAAVTKAITIGTVAEPFSPRTMYAYESTQFAGTATSLTLSLGTGGASTYYLSAFALLNASPTTHDGGNVPPAANTGTTTITALFTGNANLNGAGFLTAGAVQIKVCGVLLQ